MAQLTTQIRAPVQDRSARTLERILAATEKLLAKRAFRDISVAQIVAASKTSTGSFYARFLCKEALLPAMYDRYDRSVSTELAAAEREEAWPPPTLGKSIEFIVGYFVAFFERRRNLLAALALFVRESPSAVDEATRRNRRCQHAFFIDGLLRHQDAIHHPRPKQAAETALYTIVTVCRERILFADSPHSAALTTNREQIVAELNRMILSYLTCKH